MRIFSNYDGWQMSRRSLPLGEVSYQDHIYNLDDDAQALRLIIELLNDDVIGLLKDEDTHNLPRSIYSLRFIFKAREDWVFNVKPDGTFNHIHHRAMFSNLKHRNHITVIPKEKDA